MAREEAPGMIPGTSQKDDLLDLHTPTKIDPEIGEGALLLGMIAAGDATDMSESRKGFAPVVATPNGCSHFNFASGCSAKTSCGNVVNIERQSTSSPVQKPESPEVVST